MHFIKGFEKGIIAFIGELQNTNIGIYFGNTKEFIFSFKNIK